MRPVSRSAQAGSNHSSASRRSSEGADEAARLLEAGEVHDGRFSALARTTAFPATALIDLVLRDEITLRCVYSMQRAVDGALLVGELRSVGINVVERSA